MIDFSTIDVRDVGARLLLLAALVAGLLLLRWLIVWLFTRLVRRISVRSGSTQLADDLRIVIANTAQLVFIAAALIGIQGILQLDAAGQLFLTRLARTLIIVAVALTLYRVLGLISVTSIQLYRVTGIRIDDALLPFIRVGLQLLLLAIGVVIIIQEWGYDVSALIAGLGLGGLAFSLAAQDTVANLFGFSTIVGDRPFVVGEYIKTPDVEGIVEHVGLRSTRVRQLDQALVSVPNSRLANSVIMNWSRLNKRMVNFTLRVAPDTSKAEVERLLTEIRAMLASRPRTDPNSIVVYFTNFGEAGLELLVRCYIMIADWTEFTREREAINLEIMAIMADVFQRSGAYAQVIPFKALVNYTQPTAAPPPESESDQP